MLPDPLHPAVVHFPIVLVVILPFVAWRGLKAVRSGAELKPSWLPVVAFAFALTAVSWFALETGEQEEDVVERVVAENVIHTHEDAATLFLVLSGLVSLVALAGLMKERPGTVARYSAMVGALLLLGAGVRVGHTGGELVYEHGAALAYSQGAGGEFVAGGSDRDRSSSESRGRGEDRDDDDDGHRAR